MIRSITCVLMCALVAMAPARAEEGRDISYFAQSAEKSRYELDYDLFDFFLRSAVFEVGMSTRKRPSARSPESGSRITRGHKGPYRLEANRLTFSRLPDEAIEGLSAYHDDLERISEQIDFTKLSKAEQLVFWLNLHNVLVIEQLAQRYPLNNIKDRYDEIYEEKITTIAGVPLSINDIRLRIVYRYWDDPLVIYGFFHGVIGGPSIQSQAFTVENHRRLLTRTALEFVNSLRGVSERQGKLEVSQIYDEARALFPEWPDDLRDHLGKHARGDVKSLLGRNLEIEADTFDWQIADLLAASPSGQYSQVISTDPRSGISRLRAFGDLPPHGQDFIREVYQRQLEFIRDNPPETRVIIIDEDEDDQRRREEREDESADGDSEDGQ